MSQTHQNKNPPTAEPNTSSGKTKWIVGLLLLLFAAAAAMNLPRGYSDDLSRIGKGQAAIVLVRDKNAVPSFDLQHLMDGLRDRYAGRVEFLLTDFDTSAGRAFMTNHSVARVTLLLFDASGKLVNVLSAPQTAGNLQQQLDTLIGAKS